MKGVRSGFPDGQIPAALSWGDTVAGAGPSQQKVSFATKNPVSRRQTADNLARFSTLPHFSP
jgi:hypothetical protein